MDAVPAIETGILLRAFGAESASSMLMRHEACVPRAFIPQGPRFFCSKLARSFAPGPCPSIFTSHAPRSVPGAEPRYAFVGRQLAARLPRDHRSAFSRQSSAEAAQAARAGAAVLAHALEPPASHAHALAAARLRPLLRALRVRPPASPVTRHMLHAVASLSRACVGAVARRRRACGGSVAARAYTHAPRAATAPETSACACAGGPSGRVLRRLSY